MIKWLYDVIVLQRQKDDAEQFMNVVISFASILMPGSKSFQQHNQLQVMGCKISKMFQLQAFCAVMYKNESMFSLTDFKTKILTMLFAQ